MPELPEVETIVRELRKTVCGNKILTIKVKRTSIIKIGATQFCRSLKNKEIQDIRRVGKYIVFEFSDDLNLLVHLRMTGKFVVEKPPVCDHIHNRLIFHLDRNQALIYSDVRCFGTMELFNRYQLQKKLAPLGWDPWDKQLTPKALQKRIAKRTIAVKTMLLDQNCIAGLGNIYAAEILFDARINPLVKANKLSIEKLKRLLVSTRKILRKALKHNGTSISDYRRVDDKQGSFQNFLKVYGKENTPCPVCSQSIVKIKQNQRSTYHCPTCQR
jgi:formamidopyrimidine-DNA glycosylase